MKRLFFFSGGLCFEYDPRVGTDRVVTGPTPIGTRLDGLNANFAAGLDAAVNWGDGFVYLFKGDEYWKYDALSNQTTTSAPRKIADGWPTFPPAFTAGIDAAFNSGTGTAYFFRGDRYLRYHIANDRVDDPDPGTGPYPRLIADPNGWHGLSPAFEAGLDAAVNAGDGKLYLFKAGQYARVDFASRSVDVVNPPYPRAVGPAWSGLPERFGAAVEWVEAGSATLEIVKNPSGCQHISGGPVPPALGQAFTMTGQFSSSGYPSLCGCAEYRQFVRGTFTVNDEPFQLLLPNPDGGAPVPMLPRPAPGAADDNFREDGSSLSVFPFYGHRSAPPDRKDRYKNRDQRSGCRYEGRDSPLVVSQDGDRVVVDLDFRGVVIDVAAGGEVVVEKTWTIFCSGVL